MMKLCDQREEKLDELESKILSSAQAHGITVEPREYASQYCMVGNGYARLCSKLTQSEAKIGAVNRELSFLYNQYLLASLHCNFNLQASSYNLPESVISLYARQLQRIEQQLAELELGFYRLNNDALLKDLAILSHRLIPVGAEFVCPESGVPRSILFKKGIRQFCGGLKACLFEAGGFRPYLELHAHTLSLDEFSPAGWLQTYARLADLLKLNPSWRGVTSSSWFLDPCVADISPHLAYLRTIPIEHGATLLFSSYDRAGVSGALATSSSRRQLFEAGQYCPMIYTRIWPRSKLIEWNAQGQLV